jgi:hypothetical protein
MQLATAAARRLRIDRLKDASRLHIHRAVADDFEDFHLGVGAFHLGVVAAQRVGLRACSQCRSQQVGEGEGCTCSVAALLGCTHLRQRANNSPCRFKDKKAPMTLPGRWCFPR